MLPLMCRAQKNLFNNYNDMKGVSSVYISKAMIEMNPNLFTRDVYIGKVSGKLDCVQILSTMDNNIKKNMRKDIKALVESSKYDLLMKQKGVVSSSEFYVNRKGDKVRELIMIIDGAASLKYVYLEGEMTLKDIQSIMKYQSSGLINSGNSIYSIPNVNINLADNGFLESLEGLNNLDNLKGLESLKDMMNSDKWKKFGEEMKNSFEKEFKVKDWE
jgi:hypothetical protein